MTLLVKDWAAYLYPKITPRGDHNLPLRGNPRVRNTSIVDVFGQPSVLTPRPSKHNLLLALKLRPGRSKLSSRRGLLRQISDAIEKARFAISQ